MANDHKPGCDALGGYGHGVGPCTCGALTSPVAPEQVVALAVFDAAVAKELTRVSHVEYDSHEICKHFASEVRRAIAASPEAAPTTPLLMQDENSGRDGRRYNEWHASRPDARLNAREAAAATPAAPSAADAAYENEHPAAKRMREAFEAKYGHASNLMRAANHWFNVRTEWNEAWNRDREKPVTEDDVAAAESAMLAALAQPAPVQTPVSRESLVLVGAGALQMVVNALRRDAEEGKLARGEMVDALLVSMQPAPVQAGAQQAVAWMNPNQSFAPDAFIWSRDDRHPEYSEPVYRTAPTQAGAGDALLSALEYTERMLTNLQPHIAQACYPDRLGFIDNYVDPVIERVRAALKGASPSEVGAK